jgi:hypothetical protein
MKSGTYETPEQPKNPLTDATRCYVAGEGWCWMVDGEVIEVIETDD